MSKLKFFSKEKSEMSKNDRKRGSRKTKNSKADSNNFFTLVSRLSEILFINIWPACPFLESHVQKAMFSVI